MKLLGIVSFLLWVFGLLLVKRANSGPSDDFGSGIFAMLVIAVAAVASLVFIGILAWRMIS